MSQNAGNFISKSGAATNNAAEIAAITYAIAIAMSTPPHIPVSITSDSQLAIDLALGQCSGNATAPAQAILRPLWRALSASRDAQLLHIPSHIGHPWNELADAVAHSASLGTTSGVKAARAALFTPSPALDWLWLKWSSDSHAYPTMSNDGNFRFMSQTSFACKQDLFQEHKDSTDTPTGSTAVGLKFIVTNVLTLGDKGEKFRNNNNQIQQKAELVMEQFHRHSPNIVAAFETRARAGSWETDHFFVYSSGACKGNFGAQIWVAKDEPYATIDGTSYRFSFRDFSQIHADPRRLIGRIISKHIDVHVAAFHAPHSESNCNVVDWWDETRQMLENLPNLVILTDANATLGEENSSAVGPCGAEPQNLCGDKFHELLIALHMHVPATFNDLEHQTTWTANVGQGKFKHRLEYVALPLAWQNAINDIGTITDIDLLNKVDDHHAQPTVSILYDSHICNSRNDWKCCHISAEKLCSIPGAAQQIQQRIDSIQLQSWSTPIDQHARHIHESIVDALQDVQSKKGAYKRKSYLSRGTHDLVVVRRKVSKIVPIVYEQARLARLSCSLFAWQGARTVHRTSAIVCIGQRFFTASPSDFACGLMHARLFYEGARGILAITVCICRTSRKTGIVSVGSQLPSPRTSVDLQVSIVSKFNPKKVIAGYNMSCAYISHVKKALIDCVRIHSITDKRDFLQTKAEEIKHAKTPQQSKIAWKSLHTLMAFGGRKSRFARSVQALKDSEGNVLSDPVSIDNAKLRFFGNTECADYHCIDQIVEVGNNTCTQFPEFLNIKSVPNIGEIELVYRGAKKGKAPGIDGVINDVHHLVPLTVAKLYAPLYAKMALQIREPLAFKAGLIASFLKNISLPHSLLESQRNIMLGVGPCKRYHKAIRTHVEPALESFAGKTQCGGISSRSTDFASHMVRLFFTWAKMPIHSTGFNTTSAFSAACVFSDLSNAFYSMIRQIVVETPCIEQVVDKVSRKFDLNNNDRHELAANLNAPNALFDAHVCDHDRALISESFRCRWSVTQHSEQIAVPFTGCQPGMPLADLLFNFAFARLLDRIKTCAKQAGIDCQVKSSGNHELLGERDQHTEIMDVSFVDDGAFLLANASPAILVQQVASLCDIIHHVCLVYGFMPNYKKGKSSVVLELRGKGAPDVKHAVYIENDMRIFFSEGKQAICVVPSHVHLGSHQPNIAPEIKHRSREHAAVIGPLKKAIFSVKDLDMQTKRVYANALADSKLWFNAATWPRLSEQQYASLDSCIMKRIAPMTGMQWTAKDHRTSCATICAKAEEPLAKLRLTVDRLNYLSRLMRYAPPQLIALIQATSDAEEGFVALIKQDLLWLHAHNKAAASECGSQDPLAFWPDFAAFNVSRWYKHVSIARSNGIRMQNDKLHLQNWSKKLDLILPGVGLSIVAEPEREHDYMCECGSIFFSVTAWRQHLSKAHRWRHPTFSYTRGTVCNSCSVQFHSRRRLSLHWRNAEQCFRHIVDIESPLTVEEQIQQDVAEKQQAQYIATFGRGMHYAEKPAHQTDEQLIKYLAPRLDQAGEVPGYPHVSVFPASNCAERAKPPLAPRPFPGKQLFVINLFCGQRREGDIQECFEILISDMYPVCLLSVDIINDRKLGDLRREDTIALWISLFDARAILGFAAGPPCESFAAVRHVPVSQDKHGPPPLRSLEHMWGLPCLSDKHGRQVIIGNVLYRTCILLAAKAKQVGAFALIEHPKEADWLPEHPSSWRLPQTAKLLGMNYADSSVVDQCTCGTPYRKSTRLLYVNLPELPAHISGLPGNGRCFHKKHSVVLVGKGSDGRFLTAPAKEYPQPLCNVIALAMFDFVKKFTCIGQFDANCDNQLARTLAPFYTPLDPYLAAHSAGAFGADFVDNDKPVSRKRSQKMIDKELYKVSFIRDSFGNIVPDVGSENSFEPASVNPPQLDSSQGSCDFAAYSDFDGDPFSFSQSNDEAMQVPPVCNLTTAQKERIALSRQEAISRKNEKARTRALSFIRGCAIHHISDDSPCKSQGMSEPTVPFFLPIIIGRGATIHCKFKLPKRT